MVPKARTAMSAGTTISGSILAAARFKIDGKWRTSIITDPANGRMPEMTPEAKKRAAARAIYAQAESRRRVLGHGGDLARAIRRSRVATDRRALPAVVSDRAVVRRCCRSCTTT